MDDTKLWQLLGRAPRVAAPPFFAGKVMRDVAAAKNRPTWRQSALRWLAPATVAALAVLGLWPRPADGSPSASELTALDLVELLSPEDYATLTGAGWPYSNGFLSAGL